MTDTPSDAIAPFFPQNLKLWTMPDHYVGPLWPSYYVGLARTRDSGLISESNFYTFLREIGGPSETVEIVRERHWAFGWVEWIAIHQDDEEALVKADNLLECLKNWPILNDAYLSDREDKECRDFWASLSKDERKHYCEEAGVSNKYADRARDIPSELYEYLIDNVVRS